MKFSYVLFAAFAADLSTSAIAAPKRLRTLQESMSMGTKASKEDILVAADEAGSAEVVVEEEDTGTEAKDAEMSVHSKATKLFKPAPSKAAKEESMPEEDTAFAKSGKSHSISMPLGKAEKDAKAEKVMSVGKADKTELSMKAKTAKEPEISVAKASKPEPAMSVGKASKEEEPAMSVSSTKTAKVSDMSVSVDAKAEKEMSVGKARKDDMSMETKAAKVPVEPGMSVTKASKPEPAISVGKASKDEEPAMSVSSAKTAKVTEISVAVDAKAEKEMSVGKADKSDLSMEAKAAKIAKVTEEPTMSVGKADKESELSTAAKTHKVDSQSVPFGGAKSAKVMSVGKAGKDFSMKDAKAEKETLTTKSLSMLAKSEKGDSRVDTFP